MNQVVRLHSVIIKGMKKNDPVRRQKYLKFLAREERAKAEKMEKKREKKEFKDAMNGICSKLQLEDNIEINMDGPKKIITKRAHEVAMKKKSRKMRKEPEPIEAMDLE